MNVVDDECQESGDLICLKEFLDKRIEIVQEDYFDRSRNVAERVKRDMDLTEDEFERLSKMCSPNLLREEAEVVNSIDGLDSEYLSVIE